MKEDVLAFLARIGRKGGSARVAKGFSSPAVRARAEDSRRRNAAARREAAATELAKSPTKAPEK